MPEKLATSGRMSNALAHQISLLKGDRISADIVKHADVSRETFRKIERGEPVKLSTVKKIATYLKATPDQWQKILIAWINLEIGDDEARHISINQSRPVPTNTSESSEILTLAGQLNASDRKQIMMAMTRPEVRRSLPALNQLYDTIKRKGT